MPVSFGASGLEGAGFQNVVSISPHDSAIVLLGSDVGGIQRSTNGGKTWARAKDGFWLASQMKVAAIGWFPDQPGRAIACTGQSGAGGGIWESTDWGDTWTLRTQLIGFSGGNNKGISSGSPAISMNPDDGTNYPHPRSTGKLTAFDVTARRVYVGSFQDGVFWADYGDLTSWTVVPGTTRGSGVNGSNLWIRCLVLVSTGLLFFGTYGNGLYRISGGAVAHVGAAPSKVEDLCLGEAGVLYAACNMSGIWRFTSLTGSVAASDITGSLDIASSHWQAIDSVMEGATATLYAGCSRPPQDSGQSLMRYHAGAWTMVWADANVKYTISGPDGRLWFHSNYSPFSMPLGNGFVVANIAIDRAVPGKFLISGRSGVWGTENSFATNYPYVDDLGVTISRGIATGLVEGDVMIGNTDWVVLRSRDGAKTVETYRPSPNVGYDIEQFEGIFYIADGGRDVNTLGRLWSSPIDGRAWTDERLYNTADVNDDFNRTVVNGWGAASDGHGTYTLSPAVEAYRFSVNDRAAEIIVGPTATTPEARLSSIVAGDSEGLCAFAFPDEPLGGPKFGSVLLRHSPSGGPASFYELRVQLNTNTSLSAFIRRVNDAVQTYQATTRVARVYTIGDIYRARWLISTDPESDSVMVQWKVWLTTEFEPTDWTLEYFDATDHQIQDEGGIYFRAGAGTGTSAASTVKFYAWTASGTGSNADKRPLTIAVFRNASNVKRIVAAIDNSTILIKEEGDVTFRPIFGSSPMSGGEAPQKFCDMIYMGRGCLLLFHQRNGLWRSLNYGETWSHVTSPANFNVGFTGYVTYDPGDDNTAYITTPTTVYRVEDVRGAVNLVALAAAPPSPGVIRWTKRLGLLVVHRATANGDAPQLWSSLDRGASWTKQSDQVFERTATSVWDVTPSLTDKYLYISTGGNGVIIGEGLSIPPLRIHQRDDMAGSGARVSGVPRNSPRSKQGSARQASRNTYV